MLPRGLLNSLVRSSRLPRTAAARALSTSARRANVVRELEERGMLQELTSRAARKHVEQPMTVYLGVDPSARSLHVGNLLALIGLLHFRLHGHNAVGLIGGGTGAIGDPSGRSTERNALAPEVLNANIDSITKQFTAFLERGVAFAQSRTRRRDGKEVEAKEGGSVRVVNNLDWLGKMSLIGFLSSAGKMARVSTMLSRESVKSRLDSSSGLSFTEFSYQLLQAYDFLRLHRDLGCTMQLGGSDQLGNIVSGIDMIRRDNLVRAGKAMEAEDGEKKAKEEADPAFGLTFPLLTTASGEKFGKSAGNAIWLDPSMTSPFELYQFFLRTTDEEVEKYLKIFTFIRVGELDGLMHDHKAQPKNRIAQKVLAAEATELIHGQDGIRQALAATSVFYSSDLSTDTDLPALISALDASSSSSTASATDNAVPIPSLLTRLAKADFVGQQLEKVAIASGLFASKTQARKAIEAGTITLNGKRLPPKSHQRMVTAEDLLDGRLVVLKSGKTEHRAVLLE
ncbi:hypothetical protein JCM8097_005403 [Rhodosporidiobolus ruineniae]